MDRLIYLSKGKVTVVDEDDYEELSKHKWYCNQAGYACRNLPSINKHGKTTMYMHVQILGKVDGMQSDHINRDKLDNRKSNLRIVMPCQNQWNKGPRKGTSKYKGVSWHSREKKWRAKITVNKKEIVIGDFKNEEEAAKAYDKKAKEVHGDFAYVNGV